MKYNKLIGLLCLLSLSSLIFSCAGINSGLNEINSSMKDFRREHDAGDSQPTIERKLFVYYKHLPKPKKGAACNPTFVEKIDEEKMIKIARIVVTAPKDKRTGEYQNYASDKLKFHMRMDGCAMGADGFTETEYSEHQVTGTIWAFSKSLNSH